jgi:hypothetical protein
MHLLAFLPKQKENWFNSIRAGGLFLNRKRRDSNWANG